MIVVNRFRVPLAQGEPFRQDLQRARETLAERPGFVSGRVGRNTDEPELWVLTTEWESVGAYRRALSAYDVKLHRGAGAEPRPGRAERLRDRGARDRPQRRPVPIDVDPLARLIVPD